jgi:response regulator RpfG family c-di-GMP phosphodiesterase
MSMVDSGSYLVLGKQIAMAHHEHFDGNGYPEWLSGKNIPLAARIVAIADVFDALTNKRPYKAPWTKEAALDYIRSRAGIQFDPLVVEAFMEVMKYSERWINQQWQPEV